MWLFQSLLVNSFLQAEYVDNGSCFDISLTVVCSLSIVKVSSGPTKSIVIFYQPAKRWFQTRI